MWLLVSIACAAAAAQESPLSPERLYNGVGRPLMVTVEVPPGTDASLAFLDASGELLAPPRTVTRGRVDLRRVLPAVEEIRRVCYVQCLAAGQPTGSALVIQPMLSRLEPRTETAQRPDGTPYTRITGWGPEPPGTPQEEAPPPQTLSGMRVYAEKDVVLRTSEGDIVLAMRPDEAPNTVWNFLRLVEGGFYDGVGFHRVVPLTRDGDPFVIQGGDPSGRGDGGPGYWLPLEPSRLRHDFGVISMARADAPDSAGSQFFICLTRERCQHLDGEYTAFGQVTDGMDIVKALGGTDVDPRTGTPKGDPPKLLGIKPVD